MKRAVDKAKKPARSSAYNHRDGSSIYVEAPASAVFRADRFATTKRFAKLKKVPAYRMLAEAITEQILDGSMRAGEQLPTEAQLCEQFGVNRSTVREGTRVLEEANLLRRESAKRLLVSRPSREEIGNLLERALLLHEISFNELMEAMYVFEPLMARLAATHSRKVALKELEENIDATERAMIAGESVVALDIAFHGLIASLCGNRALMLAREPMSRLFYHSFDAVMSSVPGAGARMVAAHRAILEAVRNRNASDAEAWMQKHVRDFKRGYEITGLDPAGPVERPRSDAAG
ncbi:MAG: FadR/GntR family transcriptional regulator [Bradyrhizobium sp.]